MTTREMLKIWILDAINQADQPLSVVEVAKFIWEQHESELRAAGDLFYTWQYSMRWAAQILRQEGKLTLAGRKWARK